MKFLELKKTIQSGELCNALIIRGDDPFVRQMAEKQITALASDTFFNLSIFSDAVSGQDIIEACSALTFDSGKRVIIVRDFNTKSESEIARLNDYLKRPNSACILAFHVSADFEMYKQLANIEVIDCNKLDESSITRWIEAECIRNSILIDENAVYRLIRYCALSLTRISSELKKLSAYADTEQITAAMVDEFVTKDIEYKIYEFTDCVSKKDFDGAMNILYTYSRDKEIYGVMPSLYSHFRKLLLFSITPDEAVKRTKLNLTDYTYKITATQAKQFTQINLKKINELFYDADYNLKTGRRASEEEVLKEIVLSIMAM